MLKGDLGTTPLDEVLIGLADAESTGCLHIDPCDGGDEALVYVKSGQIYSVHVPGRRPQLGARLVSSGALPPEALEEALDAQQTELHGWRLGELLVHLGYVDQSVVSAFVIEQVREATYDLSSWRDGTWKFRKNEKTREDVGGRSSVTDLLAEVERRRAEWKRIKPTIQGPKAIPVLSSAGVSAAEMTLDQDQWALLCKVDGERDVVQLARDCGFTTYEAGQVVFGLVGAGLIEVETAVGEYDHLDEDEDAPDEDAPPMSTADALGAAITMLGGKRPLPTPARAPRPDPGEDAVADAADTPSAEPVDDGGPAPAGGGADEWADLLGDIPGGGESELGRLFSFGGPSEDTAPAPYLSSGSDDDDGLSKVSEALSALLDGGLEPAAPPPLVSLSATPDAPPPLDAAELALLERTRDAAAEELARAHAEAERAHEEEETQNFGAIEALVASLRESPPPPPSPLPPPAPTRAEVIAAEEEAARLAEDAERAAAAEGAALAARVAQAAADRVAEQAAADRVAEQVEADRLAADAVRVRQEAERAAEQVEADRLAADAVRVRQEAERAAEQVAREAARPTEPAYLTPALGDVAAALRDLGEVSPPPPPPPPSGTATADGYADGRDDEERAADDRAHAASQRRHDNDTASLLRELSSLGLDDETRTPPTPPARPSGPARPSAPPPKDQGKKRKGLFGR